MNKALVKCFETVYSWIEETIVFVYIILILPLLLIYTVKTRKEDAAIISFLKITLKLTEWLSYYRGRIISILYSKKNLEEYYSNICKEKEEKYEEFQKISCLDRRKLVSAGLHLTDLKMYAFAVEDSGRLPQSVAKSDQDEES